MKKVFVGLSGGVDSAVAAYLLCEEGYDVVPVFISTWHKSFPPCSEGEDRLSAMQVAAYLGLPFLTHNASEVYKSRVADFFIEEYRRGRTPNPDMVCNSAIKFGVFYDYALEAGADYVATGHYARLKHSPLYATLLRGIDPSKDQSYFLASVDQGRFNRVLFPLGTKMKTEVRAIAKRINLPNAERKDSQGVCMLGDIPMDDFLREYIALQRGDVLDDHGLVIGHHDGATAFTIGQRYGFTITKMNEASSPLYVIAKDTVQNTITVGAKPPHSLRATYRLSSPNVHRGGAVADPLSVVFRYHGHAYHAHIEEKGEEWLLHLEDEHDVPAIGQYAVVYKEDEVVLGGTIEGVL